MSSISGIGGASSVRPDTGSARAQMKDRLFTKVDSDSDSDSGTNGDGIVPAEERAAGEAQALAAAVVAPQGTVTGGADGDQPLGVELKQYAQTAGLGAQSMGSHLSVAA